MQISIIGLDIAKNMFQAHGLDEKGEAVLRRRIRRGDLLRFFSRLDPFLIAMEACATAHYWARELTALGHATRSRPLPISSTSSIAFCATLIDALSAGVDRTTPPVVSLRSQASARSRLRRWPHRFLMPLSSNPAGTSPPGSASCRGRTRAAARRALDGSARWATAICASSWSSA